MRQTIHRETASQILDLLEQCCPSSFTRSTFAIHFTAIFTVLIHYPFLSPCIYSTYLYTILVLCVPALFSAFFFLLPFFIHFTIILVLFARVSIINSKRVVEIINGITYIKRLQAHRTRFHPFAIMTTGFNGNAGDVMDATI